ncbi:MAG: Rab family GTPase [Thermoplasmata archaeon]
MSEASSKARAKMKICAVGEEAVGKTSLIRRFVDDVFEGEYIRTLGTLLSKKTVEVEGPEGRPTVVDVLLWDIMGQRGFMDLLQDAYFYNASGIFAVLDITRKESLEALHGWLKGVFETAESPSVIILANKSDLQDQGEVLEEDLATLGEAYDVPFYLTSAKTGDNCNLAFEDLIRLALERGGRPVSIAAASGQAV